MTGHAITPRVESRLTSGALIAGVLGLAAAAWLVLIPRMAGMDMGPGGDPGPLGWFTITWAVMTVAMMFPASAPAVLAPAPMSRHNRPAAAAMFLVGYLAVWMLAGLIGYAFVVAVRGLDQSALDWSSGGRYAAAVVIAGAALYQLTPAKRRWLARCRSHADLGGLRSGTRGRGGIAGALRAGVEHGGCCVACCWTLMVALYALGMMSIAWMAALTVLIAAERLVPRAALGRLAVGASLLVLAIAVLVG
jgi:predicted metal-binding membrane protein